MPFNGSGTFNSPPSTFNPAVLGSPADTNDWNAHRADIDAGLTNVITRDGQSPATANIPFGGNRITGLGAGTSGNDGATVAQTSSDSTKNMDIAFSVASNALTAALKGADGNDPSATNPVSITFRSATTSAYSPTVVRATAAVTFTVSSGSTLGATSAVPRDLFWYAGYTGSAIVLGVSAADIGDEFVASSTAEGGAGAADSATVLYSTSAQTSIAWRKLLRTRDTQTTAGTYTSTPTEKHGGADLNRRFGEQLLYDSGEVSGVSSIDIPNVFSTAYAVYDIDFINILPATNNVELWARVSTDNGSTYLAGTGYAHARNAGLSGGTSGASGSGADSKWVFSAALQNTLGHFVKMRIRAQGGASGLRMSMIHETFAYLFTGGNDVAIVNGGGWIDQQNVNAIRFLMSSGNISGRVRVYGRVQ